MPTSACAARIPLGRRDARPNRLFVDAYDLTPDGRYVVLITSRDQFGRTCRKAIYDNQGESFAASFRLSVYDRRTGRTRRVRVRLADEEPATVGQLAASRKARVIVFGPGGVDALHAVNRRTGKVQRVDVTSDEQALTDARANDATISDDGRFVAYHSWAPFDDADSDGRRSDIFVRDLRRGRTSLESVDALGSSDEESYAPSLSRTGRFVAFHSDHDGFINPAAGPWVYVRDRRERTTTLASVSDDGRALAPSLGPAISGDGRSVSFGSRAPFVADDTNGVVDIFVRRLR